MGAEPFRAQWFSELLQARGRGSAAALVRFMRERDLQFTPDVPSKIKSGVRRIQPNEMGPIWAFFGLNPGDLPAAMKAAATEAPPGSNGRRFERSDIEGLAPDVVLPPPGEEQPAPDVAGNRDVEVRGISVGGGGDDGDFSFNGEVIDYIARPIGIRNRRGVFVTYAVNDSMKPKYVQGDPLFVDTLRPPAIGDDVIIELFPEIEGQAGPSFVKRLVRRSGSIILVEQFNPAKEIEFDRKRVRQVLRIIPFRELVGL